MWILRLRDWVGSGTPSPKWASFIPGHAFSRLLGPWKNRNSVLPSMVTVTGAMPNQYSQVFLAIHSDQVWGGTIRSVVDMGSILCMTLQSDSMLPADMRLPTQYLKAIFHHLPSYGMCLEYSLRKLQLTLGELVFSRDDAGSLSSLVSSADSCSIGLCWIYCVL